MSAVKTISNRSGYMTRNILATYNGADSKAHQYGDNWYRAAHTFGVGLAEEYGVTVRQACGIIAALSPACAWDRNMVLADTLLATGDCSHMYGNATIKARNIIAGGDPSDVLGGDKVRSFFDNILNWETSIAVTVDRHAFDVAIGRATSDPERKVLGNGGRVADICGETYTRNYQTIANSYRSAANMLGVVPHQVQAVTWCAWRDAKGLN